MFGLWSGGDARRQCDRLGELGAGRESDVLQEAPGACVRARGDVLLRGSRDAIEHCAMKCASRGLSFSERGLAGGRFDRTPTPMRRAERLVRARRVGGKKLIAKPSVTRV